MYRQTTYKGSDNQSTVMLCKEEQRRLLLICGARSHGRRLDSSSYNGTQHPHSLLTSSFEKFSPLNAAEEGSRTHNRNTAKMTC